MVRQTYSPSLSTRCRTQYDSGANAENYPRELWAGALSGGRINYHPVWPGEIGPDATRALLYPDLVRCEGRVRLLNHIVRAPLDCPVAVVFGHACAMNWAGPSYDDVGIGLTDLLWRRGYPADLIPTTEIESDALAVGQDGAVRYGKQRYTALVLYHPQFEGKATAAFLRRAAEGAKTALFVVGPWDRDFEGADFHDLEDYRIRFRSCLMLGRSQTAVKGGAHQETEILAGPKRF